MPEVVNPATEVFFSAPVAALRPPSAPPPPFPVYESPAPEAPAAGMAAPAPVVVAPLPPLPTIEPAPKADEAMAPAPPLGSPDDLDDAFFNAPLGSFDAPETAPATKASNEPSGARGLPTEEAAASREGAASEGGAPHAPEDDLDDASLSSKFFRSDAGEDASIAPVVDESDEPTGFHDDDEEPGSFAPASPDAIARRARMRRVVGGLVAFVGVIALAVVGKAVVGSSKSSSTAAQPAQTAPAAPAAPKPEAKAEAKPAEAKPAPAPAPTAEPAKPAETAAPEASAEAKADPPAEAKPAEGTPDPERSAALQKETVTLLNRGKFKDAIEKAREAIAADPSQALPYLYLGSALQDSGKWKQGIDAYSDCVRNATKGPVHECRQMGGKK